MLHAIFQPQKVGPKINVARKVHVKKSCNKELLRVQQHRLRVPDVTQNCAAVSSSHLDTQLFRRTWSQVLVGAFRLYLVRIFTDGKLPMNSKKNFWEASDE